MTQYSKKATDYIVYNKPVDLKRLYFIVSNLCCFKPAAGTTVLDVGCGNGNISIFLGSLGYQVSGIDVSEAAITKARQLNKFPNVKFEVGNAEELPDLGTRYDVIICSEVLEHLLSPESTLYAISRIMKDDGILFVTVPNGKGPREVLVTRPVQKLQRSDSFALQGLVWMKKVMGYSGATAQSDADDLGHIQFFSKQHLYQLAECTGFAIKKFGHADFVGDVFPFSFLFRRSRLLQKIDCKLADKVPYYFTSGFQSMWVKGN